MHKIFRYPKIFWNIEEMPTKFFGTVRHENFGWKLWYIRECFFDTRNFLKHRMVPWWSFFGHVRWKYFHYKTVKLPPPLLENFRYQNSFETQKCSSTIFIGTVRKKISTEFSDIPFLWIKFCNTRDFLKHQSVAQRNFSVLWDKKLWAKSRDNPSVA